MTTPGEEKAIRRLLRLDSLSVGEIAKRVGVNESVVRAIKKGMPA